MQITRRKIITHGAGLAATALISAPAIIGPARAAPLKVRRSVTEMKDDDIFFQDYAEAIAALHNMPQQTNNLWRQQALIHLNNCPHGKIGFLPWHRHYIAALEKLCGEVLGKPEFTLAYWDWTKNRGRLHKQFFKSWPLDVRYWNDPSGGSSPNWPGGPVNTSGTRWLTASRGLQDHPRGREFTSARIARILKLPNFNLFRRRLENPPHNLGHTITGAGGGHMTSGMSPLDPAFWLHHANVDRLWAQWQDAGNTTPSINQKYAGQFIKADGTPLAGEFSADDARDLRKMGVRYDTQPETKGETPAKVSMNDLLNKPEFKNLATGYDPSPKPLGSAKVNARVGPFTTVDLKLVASEILEALFMPRFFRPADIKDPDPKLGIEGGRILARLSGIRGSGNAETLVTRVFVNCPYLSPEVPEQDPHYADSFSFFMPPLGHHASEVLIDITDPVRRQAGEGRIDPSAINIQLSALPVILNSVPSANTGYTVETIQIIRA